MSLKSLFVWVGVLLLVATCIEWEEANSVPLQYADTETQDVCQHSIQKAYDCAKIPDVCECPKVLHWNTFWHTLLVIVLVLRYSSFVMPSLCQKQETVLNQILDHVPWTQFPIDGFAFTVSVSFSLLFLLLCVGIQCDDGATRPEAEVVLCVWRASEERTGSGVP